MKNILLIAMLNLLISCDPVVLVDHPLPLFAGYRDPADQCVRVGENNYTNQFLDDSAALVGCPASYEGLGVFVHESNGVLVGEALGYLLYSVPFR